MKSLYSITIKNWEKYNANQKKGHKATLISNNFCHDSKLGVLPLPVRWLYLGILLTCGDHTRDTIEMNEKQVRELLESSWSIDRALTALQSLQLLTYSKNDFFINRIEKKVIEKKRKEVRVELEIASDPPPQNSLVKIWNENCGKLSKVVTINAKRRKSIESRWKELDELQWVEVVKKISSSDFCNGKNDRGWKADFDFLLKPDTATRTLEGRYDNREGIKNGMTEDGRYLTNAMKRSHNNLAMFKKLNGDDSEERDVEASVSDG